MTEPSKPVPRPDKGLTVNFIKSLKLAGEGQAYEVADKGETRRLRIRVSSRSMTFYMCARWKKGAVSATSRAIGEFSETEEQGCVTLLQARQQVREWEKLRRVGIDPQVKSREERRDADAKNAALQSATFSAVTEDYLHRDYFRQQRQQRRVEKEIRRHLLAPERNRWVHRPIAEIEDTDVAELLARIRDLPAPAQAVSIHSHLRLIFSFAVIPENRGRYNLKVHPIAHLKRKDFGLRKRSRTVTLDDNEICAFWNAASAIPYPMGSFYKLLCAGGQRVREWAHAQWSEIDLDAKTFTIPEVRFKSGTNHIVPLSDLMIEILTALPRCTGDGSGDYLISFSDGKKPVNSFSSPKKKLDDLMLKELRQYATVRGEDPDKVKLKKFVHHDLRRVVRTAYSRLKVPEAVAEAAIGHGKVGLDRIYNQWEYFDEKREALQLWANLLRKITQRPEPL